jgi:hypothetical protein
MPWAGTFGRFDHVASDAIAILAFMDARHRAKSFPQIL